MIYLDNAATTPVNEEVWAAAAPYLRGIFANPSSSHDPGKAAREALEQARDQIAEIVGARSSEIIFTSGGTEANNTALSAIAFGARADSSARGSANEIIISSTEHASIYETAKFLSEHHGFIVHEIGTDKNGTLNLEQLRATITENTVLLSVAYANNEVATVQDLAQIAEVSQEHGAVFHSDAVQAAGWLPLHRDTSKYDLLSLSGHKIGAFKGSGVLVAPTRLPWVPLLHGGGQERNRRSGTENVPGAVAFAKALEIAERGRAEFVSLVQQFQDALVQAAISQNPQLQLSGHPSKRLAGLISFVHPGINGETVLLELERRGVVCASGSACSAGSTEPSRVLLALGYDADTARTALRLSLPRYGSEQFYSAENAQALASGLTSAILAAQS